MAEPRFLGVPRQSSLRASKSFCSGVSVFLSFEFNYLEAGTLMDSGLTTRPPRVAWMGPVAGTEGVVPWFSLKLFPEAPIFLAFIALWAFVFLRRCGISHSC